MDFYACFTRRRRRIIYTDNLAHKIKVGCTNLRIKIIAIKVKYIVKDHHYLQAGR
jgi:hypothetical protein